MLQFCRSGVKPAWLSLCFLSPLSKLWQGFCSPEVMVASFLAEIWKERDILWLSFERWLDYWDTTNKGWCRPGIPHLALPLSFLPFWSLSSQLSLYFCPQHREELQYLRKKRKHMHLQQRRHNKTQVCVCVYSKSPTTTCARIPPPRQLFCINHKSPTADCSLPKPVVRLPASRCCSGLTQCSYPSPHSQHLPIQLKRTSEKSSSVKASPSSQAGAGRRAAFKMHRQSIVDYFKLQNDHTATVAWNQTTGSLTPIGQHSPTVWPLEQCVEQIFKYPYFTLIFLLPAMGS